MALALRGHNPEGKAALQHLVAWIFGGFLYVLIKNYCLFGGTFDLENFYFLYSFSFPRPGFLEPLFSNSVRTCWLCSAPLLPCVLLRVNFRLIAANTRVQTCCLGGYSLDSLLFLISMGGLSPWDRVVQTKGCTNKLLYKAQLSQLLHPEQYMSSQQSDLLTETLMSSVDAVLR